jgi:hypothetical protein
MKTQVVVDKTSKVVICTEFCEGKRRHDFKLFKASKLPLKSSIQAIGDSGYQGILALHKNSEIPKKKKKNKPLSKKEKSQNHKISKKRIFVENVIGAIKNFKILARRYRNRRKRFGLRFNLMAGIYNFELKV